MSWASDNVKKFAVIGTSCSGKTTLTYSILAHLKQMGIHCDGVLQQDRRFSFDRDQLEKYKEAQYYFICNQIMRETELTLRGHAEVIVSDRSVLDLYAYYVAMYGMNEDLLQFVGNWCRTYIVLYYLDPLPYIDDKQRPSDKFRLQVDEILKELIQMPIPCEIVTFDRKDVLESILSRIGHKLTDVDLNIIPEILGMPVVLLGGSYAFNRATKYSDVDVYVLRSYVGVKWPTGEPMQYITDKDMQDQITKILGIKTQVTIVNEQVWKYLKDQGFKEIGWKNNA